VVEIKITKSKQLLVEGKTPLIFFKALLEHLELPEINVQNFGSNQDLRGFLRTFVTRPEFKDKVEAYAIIRDAEQQPAASAFSSVCHSINIAGHQPPGKISVFTESNPKVGVYILPNCLNNGMLETLCLESVMSPGLSNCIETFFKCIGGVGVVQPANQAKAYTRAFLATQDIDEAQVGRAAQRGLWKWEHAAFDGLRAFLRAL
jgi:hypothetical protein